MKQMMGSLLIGSLCMLSAFAADDNRGKLQQAITGGNADQQEKLAQIQANLEQSKLYFKQNQFERAMPGFQAAIDAGINVKENQCCLGQCLFNVAGKTRNEAGVDKALTLLEVGDPISRKGTGDEIVVVSNQGLGDSFQHINILDKINAERVKQGLKPITLYLSTSQRILATMEKRSTQHTPITCSPDFDDKGDPERLREELDRLYDKTVTIKPLISCLTAKHIFAPREPNLVQTPQAIEYWASRINKNIYNGTAVTNAALTKVLGGKILKRNQYLKPMVDLHLLIAKEVFGKGPDQVCVRVITGPPWHKVWTEPEFEKLDPVKKKEYRYNVIPPSYARFVTQVVQENGREPNGPFNDSITISGLSLTADTGSAHARANRKIVKELTLPEDGETIAFVPKANKDGSSNMHFSWLPEKDGTTPWYGKNFRIFEVSLGKKELNPAAAIATLQVMTERYPGRAEHLKQVIKGLREGKPLNLGVE